MQHGHEIIALGNLCPLLDTTDELDSYMYQTVGHQLIMAYAACTGLPLFRRRLTGCTKQQVSLAMLHQACNTICAANSPPALHKTS